MTAVLDRLIKLGLIYRTLDQSDKRIRRSGLIIKGIKSINCVIELPFDDASHCI